MDDKKFAFWRGKETDFERKNRILNNILEATKQFLLEKEIPKAVEAANIALHKKVMFVLETYYEQDALMKQGILTRNHELFKRNEGLILDKWIQYIRGMNKYIDSIKFQIRNRGYKYFKNMASQNEIYLTWEPRHSDPTKWYKNDVWEKLGSFVSEHFEPELARTSPDCLVSSISRNYLIYWNLGQEYFQELEKWEQEEKTKKENQRLEYIRRLTEENRQLADATVPSAKRPRVIFRPGQPVNFPNVSSFFPKH